jgi:uncharacterized membrane-anchored protein
MVVGAVARRSWFYWFFGSLATIWLWLSFRLFFLGDAIHPPGAIAGVIQSYFGDGAIYIVFGILVVAITYGGTFWLTWKGWKTDKSKKYPFALSKKVKLATVFLWVLFWVVEAFAAYSAYINIPNR